MTHPTFFLQNVISVDDDDDDDVDNNNNDGDEDADDDICSKFFIRWTSF